MRYHPSHSTHEELEYCNKIRCKNRSSPFLIAPSLLFPSPVPKQETYRKSTETRQLKASVQYPHQRESTTKFTQSFILHFRIYSSPRTYCPSDVFRRHHTSYLQSFILHGLRSDTDATDIGIQSRKDVAETIIGMVTRQYHV